MFFLIGPGWPAGWLTVRWWWIVCFHIRIGIQIQKHISNVVKSTFTEDFSFANGFFLSFSAAFLLVVKLFLDNFYYFTLNIHDFRCFITLVSLLAFFICYNNVGACIYNSQSQEKKSKIKLLDILDVGKWKKIYLKWKWKKIIFMYI